MVLALRLNKTPEEIRAMPITDFYHMISYLEETATDGS